MDFKTSIKTSIKTSKDFADQQPCMYLPPAAVTTTSTMPNSPNLLQTCPFGSHAVAVPIPTYPNGTNPRGASANYPGPLPPLPQALIDMFNSMPTPVISLPSAANQNFAAATASASMPPNSVLAFSSNNPAAAGGAAQAAPNNPAPDPVVDSKTNTAGKTPK